MNARADASPTTGFTALDRILRKRVLDQLRALQGRAIVLADPLGCIRTGDAEHAAAPLRIDVHGPGFYRALAGNGSVGAAEAYMDGAWDCSDLVGLVQLLAEIHELPASTLGTAQPLAK